jgi:hypothetical protein
MSVKYLLSANVRFFLSWLGVPRHDIPAAEDRDSQARTRPIVISHRSPGSSPCRAGERRPLAVPVRSNPAAARVRAERWGRVREDRPLDGQVRRRLLCGGPPKFLPCRPPELLLCRSRPSAGAGVAPGSVSRCWRAGIRQPGMRFGRGVWRQHGFRPRARPLRQEPANDHDLPSCGRVPPASTCA